MEEKNLICINCPLGCPLTVTLENGEVKTVTGNTCPRGEAPLSMGKPSTM